MSETEVGQTGASASNGPSGNKRATVSDECEGKINGVDGILATKRVCTEQPSDDKPVTRDLNKKRTDYLEWPDYFMAIAFLSAQRSKDPSSQVGACIVNEQKKIVGIGYNGMPRGCSDDVMPWRRTANDRLQTKYLYVCHAEMNAILNKNSADVENCTIYVALFPCNECAKLIIQSGIKEVVYLSDKYHDMPEFIASRKMMDLAKVKYRQYTPKMSQILIDFGSMGPSTTGGPSKDVHSAGETNNNTSKDT